MNSNMIMVLILISLTTAGCTDVPMFDWFIVAIAFATGWKLTDLIFTFLTKKITEYDE